MEYHKDNYGQTIINVHDINTFQSYHNEVHLCGTDQKGEPVHIILQGIEVLEWMDMKRIKEQALKYVESL